MINQVEDPKTTEKRNRSDVSTPTSVEHLSKKLDMGDQGDSPCPIKKVSRDWTNDDEEEGEGRETSTPAPQTKPQEQETNYDIVTPVTIVNHSDMEKMITKAVNEAIQPLQTLIMDLKIQIQKLQQQQQPKLMSALFHNPAAQVIQGQTTISKGPTNDIQLAKRTMGFNPITPSDIKRHHNNNNNNLPQHEQFQLAGTRTLEEFMSRDLKMPHSTIARLRTRRVFHPQSGTGSNTFYAEFDSEDEVATIRRYAHNLSGSNPEDPKLSLYIPKSLQKLHSDLQQIAFTARNSTPKMSTKIWFGDNLELRIKESGSKKPWASIDPVNPTEFWKSNSIVGKMKPSPTPKSPTPTIQPTTLVETTTVTIPTSNTFDPLTDLCSS